MAKKSKGFQELLREKKNLQHRKENLQILVQRVQEDISDMDVEMQIEPTNLEKMSEILQAFVAPYISNSDTLSERKSFLNLAVIAWNSTLFPEDQQQTIIDKFLGSLSIKEEETKQEVRRIINTLTIRKQRYFANVKRFIAEFRLTETKDEFHLSVASITPRESLNEASHSEEK
ncbi:MAG TPA: hypothetical protein VK184_24575 [Nostocaceae cyanobacterium]|nr:hypothetical protein [Nostocaceae cyanobacterium]